MAAIARNQPTMRHIARSRLMTAANGPASRERGDRQQRERQEGSAALDNMKAGRMAIPNTVSAAGALAISVRPRCIKLLIATSPRQVQAPGGASMCAQRCSGHSAGARGFAKRACPAHGQQLPQSCAPAWLDHPGRRWVLLRPGTSVQAILAASTAGVPHSTDSAPISPNGSGAEARIVLSPAARANVISLRYPQAADVGRDGDTLVAPADPSWKNASSGG